MVGIYDKVLKLQSEIGQFRRDKKNPHFRYNYASAEGVNDAIKPLLEKLGIVAQLQVSVADVQSVNGVVVAEGSLTLIDASDGSSLTFTSIGSGTDNGDKHAMKAATAASKYATIAAVFGSFTDDPEADEATDAPQKPAAKAAAPDKIGETVAVVVTEAGDIGRVGRGPFKLTTPEGVLQSFDEATVKSIHAGSIVVYRVTKFGKEIVEVKNGEAK